MEVIAEKTLPSTVIIERVYLKKETLGSLYLEENSVLSNWIAKTLELPWLQNKHNISCIPEGNYTVIKEKSSNGHQYPHFRVINVPNRNGILWHKITYVKDLRGCIGIGGRFQDLNSDNIPDIIESSITLQRLYDMLPNTFKLIIREK